MVQADSNCLITAADLCINKNDYNGGPPLMCLSIITLMHDAGMTNVALHTLYLQAKIPEHDGNREASAQDGVKKLPITYYGFFAEWTILLLL